MSEKERLLLFMRSLGMGQNKFEKSVGWGSGYIGHLRDDSILRTAHLILLKERYPQLNQNWLKTGEGNMLNDDTDKVIAEPETEYVSPCPLCKEKEQLIESLKEQIRVKDELIEMLKGNNK